MIDIRKLKELVRLMVENELSELNLQDQQETVQVKRGGAGGGIPMVAVGGQQVHIPASRSVSVGDDDGEGAAAAPAGGGATGGGGGGGGDSEAGLVAVVSPMVGTFYGSPKPDAPMFVKVGDSVSPDTTVCLVEAMKVFNEIKAETSGTIVKCLVQSGSAVEYGQKLFLVRPS